MTLKTFAYSLGETALGASMRQADPVTVLGIQIGHVLGLILLLTALLVINLRLLGYGLNALALPDLTRVMRKSLRIGLGLTVISGSLLFLSAPVHYAGNSAFLPKMALLLAALAVQVTLFRKVTAQAAPSPVLARTTALLSLGLWFGVGLAGRAIGFV